MTITLFFYCNMITVPTQLYVGLSKRDDSDVPLGFATPFGSDKAFEKRKETVDRWATPTSRWIREQNTWVTDSALDPVTIDNEPAEGFQISKSVRRTGWNSGNVVWRLEDPRGFELEISSANFAAIVNHCKMDKGMIKSKCVWGREGAQNVLLPEGSEPYNEAFKATARAAKRLKKGEFKPGNMVELKDGRIVEYVGEFSVAVLVTTESRSYRNDTSTYVIETRNRHIIKTQLTDASKNYQSYVGRDFNVGDVIYEFVGTLNVSNVTSTTETTSSTDDRAQTVLNWVNTSGAFNLDHKERIIAIVAPTKEVPTVTRDATTLADILMDQDDPSKRLYAFWHQNADSGIQMFVTTGYRTSHGKGVDVTFDLDNRRWETFYNSRRDTYYTELTTMVDINWNKLVVNWCGKQYDLRYA